MASNNVYPLHAVKLNATYVRHLQELSLFAECEVQPYTFDITFRRVPLIGGLKFVLEGRVLAIGRPKEEKPHTQSFKMPPPIVHDVIIVDADHLEGVLVPIHFIDRKNSSSEGTSEPSTKEDSSKIPQTLALENEEINVINGRTFTIKVPSEVPRFGSINMDHDPRYLELLTAGIRDKDIYWEFKALQPTHDTQVRLFFAGGIAQYVYEKVYNVFIGLANEPVVELGEDGLLPPFFHRVEQCIEKIKEKYSDAQLHDVDYRPPVPKKCKNPFEMALITVSCEVKVNGRKHLASVHFVGYGPISPIELRERKLDDRRSFEWPVQIDILKADELMKKAGFKGPYTSATLDFSDLPSGDMEPNYTFFMVMIPGGPREVRVGANSGSVTPIGQALPPNGS